MANDNLKKKKSKKELFTIKSIKPHPSSSSPPRHLSSKCSESTFAAVLHRRAVRGDGLGPELTLQGRAVVVHQGQGDGDVECLSGGGAADGEDGGRGWSGGCLGVCDGDRVLGEGGVVAGVGLLLLHHHAGRGGRHLRGGGRDGDLRGPAYELHNPTLSVCVGYQRSCSRMF